MNNGVPENYRHAYERGQEIAHLKHKIQRLLASIEQIAEDNPGSSAGKACRKLVILHDKAEVKP